jgi:hypothetical protein
MRLTARTISVKLDRSRSPPYEHVTWEGQEPMQITLYHRSYPVKDAPTAVSFVPFSAAQRHTFTADGTVYDAERRELLVIVPDDAKLDTLKNLLSWGGDKGRMKSTATEVFAFAQSNVSGFRLVK